MRLTLAAKHILVLLFVALLCIHFCHGEQSKSDSPSGHVHLLQKRDEPDASSGSSMSSAPGDKGERNNKPASVTQAATSATPDQSVGGGDGNSDSGSGSDDDSGNGSGSGGSSGSATSDQTPATSDSPQKTGPASTQRPDPTATDGGAASTTSSDPSPTTTDTPSQTTTPSMTATTPAPTTDSTSTTDADSSTAPSASTSSVAATRSSETPSSSVASGSSALPSSSTTSAQPSSTEPASDDSSGNNKAGTIAGAVVGSVAGVAIIVGLIGWFSRRRGWSARRGRGTQNNDPSDYMYENDLPAHGSPHSAAMAAAAPGTLPFNHSRRFVPPTSAELAAGEVGAAAGYGDYSDYAYQDSRKHEVSAADAAYPYHYYQTSPTSAGANASDWPQQPYRDLSSAYPYRTEEGQHELKPDVADDDQKPNAV